MQKKYLKRNYDLFFNCSVIVYYNQLISSGIWARISRVSEFPELARGIHSRGKFSHIPLLMSWFKFNSAFCHPPSPFSNVLAPYFLPIFHLSFIECKNLPSVMMHYRVFSSSPTNFWEREQIEKTLRIFGVEAALSDPFFPHFKCINLIDF